MNKGDFKHKKDSDLNVHFKKIRLNLLWIGFPDTTKHDRVILPF